MTNRPKLDVDIKRAGRLDKKIPFLYPDVPELVEEVVTALLRKHKIKHGSPSPRIAPPCRRSSSATRTPRSKRSSCSANDYAGEADSDPGERHRRHPRLHAEPHAEMLEYMELLAVFEASNRKMLPKKYRDITTTS